MTPIEIRNHLVVLTDRLGLKASASILIGHDDADRKLVTVLIRPYGYDRDRTLWAYGPTFEEAFADADKVITADAEKIERTIVRKMALAIIDKADGGQVLDRALMSDFSAGEVAKHGDAACAEATRLAGNAPFSIVKGGAPALSVA